MDFGAKLYSLKPDTILSIQCVLAMSDGVTHSSLCTYPKFSHLQQQNMQTIRAIMITPPSTARVMIRIWKFTAHTYKKRGTMRIS